MQFSSVQDVNAPLDFVFGQISDFDAYENYAMRVGAEVARLDTLSQKAAGMKWNVIGDFRGKTRNVNLNLQDFRPDNLMIFEILSGNIEGKATFESMALTRKQSRIKLTVNLKPKSIPARLLLQSAKLARSRLNKKFNHRFWTYANWIEANYNKSLRA